MAGGAVRELITKVKFVVDSSSLSKIDTEIRQLKKSLQGINSKDKNINFKTPGLDTALNGVQRVKAQLKDLNGEVAKVHVKATIDQINKSTVMNTVKNQAQMAQPNVKQSPKESSFTDNAGTIAATGTAMVAPLAVMTNTAMDFEAAMSKVKAITNSTDADMARLAETARDLGKSTQFSATEAAQAMSYLGMAGWKTEQIIAGIPGLLDLAAASGEDLARVADIVSDDLTAFQMPAEQAAHMADVMAAASTNANTNVSMMGETFKYAGAVAGALGYSLKDVAAATGLMANSGIKAEMAGTALRSIMTRLITPPKEAGTAMDSLGISVKNADGTVKPFRQQMVELRKAFAGLGDAEKSEAAKAIAGQEAMAGFLAVVNASDEDFLKMTNAVDDADGAAAKMAQTMNNNAKGALKSLKSALEDVAITIGNVFLGAVGDGIKEVTAFIRKIGDFAKAHPKIVAGIAGAVAAIGSLLVVLGTVGIAISGINTAIGALAPVFSAVMGVLSAGFAPILAIITAAWPVVAALLALGSAAYFVYNNWDTVKELLAPLIGGVIGVFEALGETLKNLGVIWDNLYPVIEPFLDVLLKIVEIFGGLFSYSMIAMLYIFFGGFVFVFNGMAKLIQWVTKLLANLTKHISEIGEGLSGLIDKAKNFLGFNSDITAMNEEIMAGMEAEKSQYSVNQSQSNVYNIPSMDALPAAQGVSNSWFEDDFSEFR